MWLEAGPTQTLINSHFSDRSRTMRNEKNMFLMISQPPGHRCMCVCLFVMMMVVVALFMLLADNACLNRLYTMVKYYINNKW